MLGFVLDECFPPPTPVLFGRALALTKDHKKEIIEKGALKSETGGSKDTAGL